MKFTEFTLNIYIGHFKYSLSVKYVVYKMYSYKQDKYFVSQICMVSHF